MARKTNRGTGRREGGFTLLETLCAGAVLALALLGHVASTVSEHRMAHDGQYRSKAVHLAEQFVERMRADDLFPQLLGDVRTLQLATSRPGAVPLADGRLAFPPTAYYPDFVVPSEIDTLVVRVEVPLDASQGFALCETIDNPYFGLPADLNGDGKVDSASRDLDYRALPVSLTFQWVPPGHAPARMVLATWLRGRR